MSDETINLTQIKTVKSVEIRLPSLGRLYGDLLPGGIGTITPMTFSDEELLASDVPDKGPIIDQILRKRLTLGSLPYDSLLTNDKLYALCILRFISVGDEYKFSLTCGNCGQSFKNELKIPADLQIVNIKDEFSSEPISWESSSGVKFGLKYLRVSDEKKTRDFVKSVRAGTARVGSSSSPLYTFGIASMIRSINGEEMPTPKVILALQNDLLSYKETLELENFISDLNFGPSLVKTINCPHCYTEEEQRIAFTAEFFRPSRRK